MSTMHTAYVDLKLLGIAGLAGLKATYRYMFVTSSASDVAAFVDQKAVAFLKPAKPVVVQLFAVDQTPVGSTPETVPDKDELIEMDVVAVAGGLASFCEKGPP
jgi:hypothetical protein